ncbi:uncharacterized protein [Ptychodera flava]|uniref:uncharacterized protein n=1 Tax=Ptychodera flava TaxID=63121 RepID=UPI00396A6ADA
MSMVVRTCTTRTLAHLKIPGRHPNCVVTKVGQLRTILCRPFIRGATTNHGATRRTDQRSCTKSVVVHPKTTSVVISRCLCTEGQGTRPELPTSNVTFKSCGVTYDATYADAGDPKGPVIACLHGSPASHKDFATISPHLLSAGVRLIAPNFPECGYCNAIDGDSYNFSVEHKATFLKDFFGAIGVNRISVLVAHSASGPTAGQFCADTDLVQSVAFLSAVNLRPHSMVRSAGRIVHLSSWLMRNAIVGKVMRRVLPSIAVIVTRFEVNDTSYMIGMLHEMAAINWMKTRANLEMVHKSSLPVLVVASEVDRLVDIEIAKEKMELFNLDKTKDVLYIDSDGVYTRDRIDGM